MTPKEYLQQAYNADHSIRIAQQKLETMENALKICSSENSQNDSFKAACKAAEDYRRRIAEDVRQHLEKRIEIEQVIEMVVDHNQREILTRRYLLYQEWSKITAEMHYSKAHIYKLHDTALKNLDLQGFV